MRARTPVSSRRPRLRVQRGAALVVALILLTVLTLIALASLRGVVMEERMAAAQRDRSLEFQAAEAGLRAAEELIQNDMSNALGQDCINANATGCGLPNSMGEVDGCSGCWQDASGVGVSSLAAGQPQFLIQRFDSLSTASAYGLDDSAASGQYGGQQTSFTARAYYRVFSRSRDPSGTGSDGRAVVLLTANYAIPLPGNP